MHISRLAPDTWPDAMQPIGSAPAGKSFTRPALGMPPDSSPLTTSLEVFVLVTMSALVSLLLCVVAAGAV